jgi:hypothetical protein
MIPSSREQRRKLLVHGNVMLRIDSFNQNSSCPARKKSYYVRSMGHDATIIIDLSWTGAVLVHISFSLFLACMSLSSFRVTR